MDNFAEQLVKRIPSSSDKTKKIMIYAGGILVTVLLIIFSIMQLGSFLSTLGLIIAAGAGYGTFFIGQNTYVEYEYAFTNGELDVDKIIAKKKRKPMLSVEVRNFTAFGKYTDEPEESEDMTIIFSSDNIASHEYYADFIHKDYGKTRLVFSPDANMLENVKKALPLSLRKNI